MLIETILAAFEMDEILWELQRLHRRSQLRTLGLHLQLHQEVQPLPGVRAARPAAGHDDHAFPALVFAATDQDLSSPRRVRDGRHGGADPDQERSGRERGRARQGARRQGARGRRRSRRHLGRPPRARADRDGDLRSTTCRRRTSCIASSTTSRLARPTCSRCPTGTITEAGLRNNVNVSLQYMASWLGGNGCVPIHNLMEDAATAEIARSQVWQWIRHPRGVLDDGRRVTVELFRQILRRGARKAPGAARRGGVRRRSVRARSGAARLRSPPPRRSRRF